MGNVWSKSISLNSYIYSMEEISMGVEKISVFLTVTYCKGVCACGVGVVLKYEKVNKSPKYKRKCISINYNVLRSVKI